MNDRAYNSHLLDNQDRFSAVQWPVLRRVERFRVDADTCLVMCAGFEDRALAVIEQMQREGHKGFAVAVIQYLPTHQHNRISELLKLCDQLNVRTSEFVYDRERPAGFGEHIAEFLQQFPRAMIDVSGMSRLLIVQIMAALLKKQEVNVTVIYGEANVYLPSRETFDRDRRASGLRSSVGYLSSGIFEVVTTPELGSVSMLGEPIRLVAFPSFDPAQLGNLIQELQPTHIDVIHGTSPREDMAWRTQAVQELNGSSLKQREVQNQYRLSTLHYAETIDTLSKIYACRSAFDRLVVSPTGSKMQSVAVGIFRAVFDDIQIVYPTPQTFVEPESYTRGLRQLYQVELPGPL